MNYSVCLDLLYLEITPQGPVFADTDKIEEGMYLAAKQGFKCVEFWDWFNKDVDRLLKAQKALGLKVTSICAKGRGPMADVSAHPSILEGLKESIEAAKRFGCDKIIITADEVPGISHEESYKNIVKSLKEQAALAEAAGVTLILEPIFDPVPGFFRDSAKPLKAIEEVGSDHLKLLYDIFHYQLMEGNITRTLKGNMDKIGHIHVASVPDRGEIIEGELDYGNILNVIEDSGYQGYVALEYRPTMNREESLMECKKMLTWGK